MAPPKQGFPSAQEPLWGCSPHTARPLSPQPQSPGQIVSPLLKQVTVILNPVVKAAPALTEPLYVMAQVKYLSGEPCSSTQTPGAPRQGCLTHAHVCPTSLTSFPNSTFPDLCGDYIILLLPSFAHSIPVTSVAPLFSKTLGTCAFGIPDLGSSSLVSTWSSPSFLSLFAQSLLSQ